MKKKIKLRKLSKEQYSKYKEGGCGCNGSCNECMFGSVNCVSASKSCWVYHKDLYSDKFLDQEIEIEVEPIFTDKEREYLHNLLKPFKDRIVEIALHGDRYGTVRYLQIIIRAMIKGRALDSIIFPCFDTKIEMMYGGLELNKAYKGEELKALLTELKL